MTGFGATRPDPTAIGEVSAPPFARLPDPEQLFLRRSDRFRTVADGHPLKPYLLFLADLSSAQHFVQDELDPPALVPPERAFRAEAHGMPPLDRHAFTPDAACDQTLDRLLAVFGECEMPDAARAAMRMLAGADRDTRTAMMRAVLAEAVPIEAIAPHVLIAAALQVDFSRRAATLDAGALRPVAEGACPCCGAKPVASMVVDWPGAHGVRFCACSLCATLWHVVRIKCTLCGSTERIGYRHVEGGPDTIKAETCGTCGRYVKIFHQHKDPALEPVADDVASLGLDVLLGDAGDVRGSVNLFMLGT